VTADLDLRLLRALVVLVEQQGFTAAAAVMGVSQPALSQAIRRLEAAVAVQLVDRQARGPGAGVTLTPAGVALHADALAILAAADHALARVRRIGATRRLVVGFGTSAPRSLIGVVVQEGEAGGGAEVVLEHVPWGDEDARLADGHVDLLVAQLPPGATPPHWSVVVLGERQRVAVVRADHPLAGRRTIRLAELAQDTVIDAASDRSFWIVSPRPDGVEPVVVGPPASTVEEMLALVAAGRGIAFTSATVAENSGGTELAFLPVEDLSPVSVAIVRRAEDRRPAVLDLMTRLQRAWPPLSAR